MQDETARADAKAHFKALTDIAAKEENWAFYRDSELQTNEHAADRSRDNRIL